ncbi:UNVERIFIED_ORG: hypothetical protein GCAPEGMB_00294 [Vibrio phage V07]
MYDYVIHTSISDKSQLNQLAMFVGSFIETHKKGRVVCVTDLELDFTMPRLTFEKKLPDEYVFISVDNLFLQKTYGVVSYIDSGTWRCTWQKNDHDDFVIKKHGERSGLIHPDIAIANYNVSRHGDLDMYYNALRYIENAITINCKDFAPAAENKINSFYTLVFPWEIYFHVMITYQEYIDSEYVERVRANCHKFAHSVYYRKSGLLRDGL